MMDFEFDEKLRDETIHECLKAIHKYLSSKGQISVPTNGVNQNKTTCSRSGEAWISTYPIKGDLKFRACITNYLTDKNDLKMLIQLLEQQINQIDK